MLVYSYYVKEVIHIPNKYELSISSSELRFGYNFSVLTGGH